MRSNEYIFVGGSQDGRIIPLERPTQRVKMPSIDDSHLASFEVYEKMELYGRNYFGSEKTFTIYRHEDIDQITTIKKLINNYNPDTNGKN